MLLAIDIGNSNVTIGTYEDELLTLTARFSTNTNATSDEYAVLLQKVLDVNGVDCSKIEDCIISSVVPCVGLALSQAVTLLCDIVPLEVGPGVKTGLNIKIDNPAQLGADLVVGAVAAIKEYNLPCAIIDMGTATTISVVDKSGAYIGCTIGAGVRLTLNALTRNTAQLPSIDISAPDNIIGTNTIDSMKSGLVFGTASMIDGMIERIAEQIGEIPTVVATGGLSREVIKHCKCDVIYNENLLLDGLKEIYEKNK